jgi:hypothetical protein
MRKESKMTVKVQRRRQKTDQDSILTAMCSEGWEPTLTEESYRYIIATGLRSKNLPLAFVAAQIALHEKTVTLRGLMYRVVSAGWLPFTDKEHYQRLGRIMIALREAGAVPFKWIVDNIRATEKPSSWSGLRNFAETMRECYRRDFWAGKPDYVHVIVEKDAIAAVLAPVTREYDVALSPIRGYVSISFAHDIAETWNQIQKAIFAYYLGDFDASGFDLERDVQAKLTRYCSRPFTWFRLGVNVDDFAAFDLIPASRKGPIAATGVSWNSTAPTAPNWMRSRRQNCAGASRKRSRGTSIPQNGRDSARSSGWKKRPSRPSRASGRHGESE